MIPCNVLQPSPLQFQEGISHLGQLSGAQPLVSYRVSDPTMNTFCAVGCNQTPLDAVYMQRPAPAIMYAQSYEHFRRASFQVLFHFSVKYNFFSACMAARKLN